MASSAATMSGKDSLLSDEQIAVLKNRIRPILVQMGLPGPVRGQVYGHLKTLSRPAILHSARDLLAAHDFRQYASEVESFYDLRNDIVHGRPLEDPVNALVRRMLRFRRLLQKLLFSMAGIYGTANVFRAPIESPNLSAI